MRKHTGHVARAGKTGACPEQRSGFRESHRVCLVPIAIGIRYFFYQVEHPELASGKKVTNQYNTQC
jgi:hypothetical protein